MHWPFFEVLLLVGLIIPGDTVVYYVIPSESSSVDCPGQPCQILNHYFRHGDKYFSRSKVNVTMSFLQGNHTLNNLSCCFEGLNRFEMIGIEPTCNIVICPSTTINFTNTAAVLIENLTIKANTLAGFSFLNCGRGTSVRLLSRALAFVLKSTIFSSIQFYSKNYCVNFRIVMNNSALLNGSAFQFLSRIYHMKIASIREWKMFDCTVANSSIGLFHDYTKVTIVNSTFMDMYRPEGSLVDNCIKLLHSTLNIRGKVLFYNTSNGPSSFPYLISAASNVTVLGVVTFSNNKLTPILLYSSTITLSGNISFHNNSGITGGAIALFSSSLNIDSNASIYFYNNSARETGGAIHVARDQYVLMSCFYQLLDYSNRYNWYNIQFVNNSAENGGDHIYGEFMHSDACFASPENRYDNRSSVGTGTLSYLVQTYFKYHPDINSSLSPVSSDATRVCLCDRTGRPQCISMDNMHGYSITVHPGEMFHVSVVVVGADLGTTIGTVYAVFTNPEDIKLKPSIQYSQWISSNKMCSSLDYVIYSQRNQVVFYLATWDESLTTVKRYFYEGSYYRKHKNASKDILYMPPLLNITLLPCPPGFTLLGDPPGCRCYPALTRNDVNCLFINGSGYHSWNNSLWLTVDGNLTITFTVLCPFDYCITGQRFVNLEKYSDDQCSMNRAGRLCGGCKEGYSLAIGSSHCIHCPNNNHLALLLLFMAAGFLLVLFVIASNFTVTQGMINGLIFYANIVWTYESINFPNHGDLNLFFTTLRTFIAWLNLDLGIQMCFVKGLNSFWKTWLQYVFPFYIWSIAGMIICCSRYSTKITTLFGNRAVSLLITLFLLSYSKLLRTIISSIEFTPLEIFGINESYTLTAWSLDGSYTYCQFPHILIFITALAIFTFLWLPYTLLLLLMQWLRKISHLKLLRWISRFNPVYDAYFAPLKDKHHYWFGVLLIVRGLLLVIFASTYSVRPNVNYLMCLIISALLLCYANYNRVYKRKSVQFVENFFFINLILIGGSEIINQKTKYAVVYCSIFIILIAFCGVVTWSAVMQIFFKLRNVKVHSKIVSEVPAQKVNLDVNRLWNSVFDETEPLLEDNQTA